MLNRILGIFRNPTAAELKAKQLYETEANLLSHTTHLEYYSATVPMLRQRIERLKTELNESTRSDQK